MIKLLYWGFIALDVAALLVFYALNLAAAGSSRTSSLTGGLFMLVLPAILIAVSIVLFLRSSATLWRAVAFLLAAAPVVITVATKAYSDARFRANSNAAGDLLFFTDKSQRALVEAIRRNEVAVLDSLLPTVDVNARGMNDMTLLVSALRQLRTTPTQHDVLQALLKAGADPNMGAEFERPLEMALQIAARTGPAPVTLLLAAGANPNAVNASGTPIFFAGAGGEGSLEILTLLLRHGADLRAVTTKGETLLIYTATARNWNVARFLLQQGADPTQGRSFKGRTFAEMVEEAVQQQRERDIPGTPAANDALREIVSLLAAR